MQTRKVFLIGFTLKLLIENFNGHGWDYPKSTSSEILEEKPRKKYFFKSSTFLFERK